MKKLKQCGCDLSECIDIRCPQISGKIIRGLVLINTPKSEILGATIAIYLYLDF